MPRPTRVGVVGSAATVAFSAVVALTGCGAAGTGTPSPAAASAASSRTDSGGAQQDARARVAAAVENLREQSAFRVSGSTTDGALDLVYVRDVGASGTVTTKGSALTVLAAGGTVWVKADAAWYEQAVGPGSAALIGDKWVALPSTALEDVAVLTDGAAFLGGLVDPDAELAVTDVQEIDGIEVVGATDPDSGGTLWVAATGTPLPVRFDERGAVGEQGVLHFGDYGVAVPIAAPPPEQVAVVPTPAPTPLPGSTSAAPSPSATPGVSTPG